jgi:hypothetical protein
MLFGFAGFVYLSRKTGEFHYRLYVGIISTVVLLSFFFGILKLTGPLVVNVIWEFDQNSIFHVIQALAMIVLAFGIRYQLKSIGKKLCELSEINLAERT